MTLTITYTVTDQDGDSLEVEAEGGKVYVNPTTDLGLGLTIEEAVDLECAIQSAIRDAREQEADLDEPNEETEDETQESVGIDLSKGSFYITPAAKTYTFNITNPPTASECAKRQLDLIADFID